MTNLIALLKQKIYDFAYDPQNPIKCYELGRVYEALGHTAAGLTFFLKAAERTEDRDLQYECLLKMHKTFDVQKNRNTTAIAMAQRAIIHCPKRPEAYYLLSKFFENHKDYHQALTYACLGLEFADFNSAPLRGDVGYPGKYALIFQKGVNSWWWGMRQQARDIMELLVEEYRHIMDPYHLDAVQKNMSLIGCGGEVTRRYTRDLHDKLRFKFKDSNKIEENFSQTYQDLFVIGIYDGKQNGTYLEIGAGPPFLKNNTAILERLFNWKGVGIEFNAELVGYHVKDRKNQCLLEDATQSDYDKILSGLAVNGVVDYLQVDCEPPAITYEILTKIPFDKYRFGIITYEHDYYADVTRSFREKSREFLSARGYKLLVSDMGVDDKHSFEDWWYHPDLIPQEAVERYMDLSEGVKDPTKYMLTPLPEKDDGKKNYWKVTQWPTLEITTNIAEKGCVVDCAFCPQRTLEKTYTSNKRRLSLEEFKTIIDKLPKDIRITFAGFTEPWLNKQATDMLLYAYGRGHRVAAFTTGVGMKPEDVYRLKDVKFDGGPNGGLCLHLPDQERVAKHPVNENYIKVVEAFKEVGPSIQNFYVMCMSDTVHEGVRHLFPTAHVPEFWSRAGNLLTEVGVKPDLMKVMSRVKSVYHGEEPMTCNQPEDLYHNVLLPNGDVSLCCQDYSLKHIIGNLFTQEYDDILPKTQTCFDLCRFCENGVKPK